MTHAVSWKRIPLPGIEIKFEINHEIYVSEKSGAKINPFLYTTISQEQKVLSR